MDMGEEGPLFIFLQPRREKNVMNMFSSLAENLEQNELLAIFHTLFENSFFLFALKHRRAVEIFVGEMTWIRVASTRINNKLLFVCIFSSSVYDACLHFVNEQLFASLRSQNSSPAHNSHELHLFTFFHITIWKKNWHMIQFQSWIWAIAGEEAKWMKFIH